MLRAQLCIQAMNSIKCISAIDEFHIRSRAAETGQVLFIWLHQTVVCKDLPAPATENSCTPNNSWTVEALKKYLRERGGRISGRLLER